MRALLIVALVVGLAGCAEEQAARNAALLNYSLQLMQPAPAPMPFNCTTMPTGGGTTQTTCF